MIYEIPQQSTAFSNWIELIAPLVAPIISSSVDKIGAGKERASQNFQAIQAVKFEKLKAEQSRQKTNTIIGVSLIVSALVILVVFLIKRK